MTKPGPPRKPTALRLLEGVAGHHRPVSAHEPKPTGRASMPSWLGRDGREFWKRHAPQLETLGLLTAVDRESFAAVCVAYGAWRDAQRERKRRGLFAHTPNGHEQANAIIAIERKERVEFLKAAARFGMTPADRAGLEVDTGGVEDDALDRLLKRRENA